MTKLSQIAQFHPYMSPVEEIIAEAKSGRMFILIDDEGRENEGDLIIPAEHANAEAINFGPIIFERFAAKWPASFEKPSAERLGLCQGLFSPT